MSPREYTVALLRFATQTTPSTEASSLIRREAARLTRAWGIELRDVEVRFSSRLRRTIGRADLRRQRVTLSTAITTRSQLRDVLRHELAHIAVARLGVTDERHHGGTWQGLLLAIGSKPQSQLKVAGRTRKASTRLFRHECPVCDFVRVAKRPVSTWLCADCVAAGLSGRLIIAEGGSRDS